MPDYAQIKIAFDQIEGMMSEPSAQLFHLFLEQQRGEVAGPLLEIGCHKGKSAVVLAEHLQASEHLDLIDILPLLETPAFERFGSSVRFHLGDSTNLKKLLPDYGALRQRYRFIHTDASHTFDNVVNDLVHAEALLHPKGIVAVDDYENPNFTQVPLGVGCALFKHRCKLSPFLVADNKMYLCRPKELRAMLRFVVRDIGPRFFEEHRLLLARTDMGEYAPLCLRVAAADEGAIYAPAIYGEMVTALAGP